MKKTQEELILKFFSKDVPEGQWMHDPWKQEHWALASNGVLLVWIPAEKCPSVKEHPDARPITIPVVNFTRKIWVEDLEQLFQSGTMEPAYDFIPCKECDGSGEVEWNYKTHYENFDCPKCRGDGGRRIDRKYNLPSTDRIFKMGNTGIKGVTLAEICRIAKELGCKYLQVEPDHIWPGSNSNPKVIVFEFAGIRLFVCEYRINEYDTAEIIPERHE